MPKFRKKPVVIEAVQWTGDGTPELYVLMGREIDVKSSGSPQLVIRTLEGDMLAQIGDWIIRGVKGELYPVKDEIFRLTYEEVSDAAR